MNQQKLVLLGGGGHCRSVIECIESSDTYNIVGISDITENLGKMVSGYPVICDDNTLLNLKTDDLFFLVTIGQIHTPDPRIRAYDFLQKNNLRIATVVDKQSIVSVKATIGQGTVILRNVFINAGVEIGSNCIINTGAIIEHDSLIGNNVHISTGAIINGDCSIGEGCFIGSGAIISNGVTIAPYTLVGAGSIILKSIKTVGTYFGNPARRIK